MLIAPKKHADLWVDCQAGQAGHLCVACDVVCTPAGWLTVYSVYYTQTQARQSVVFKQFVRVLPAESCPTLSHKHMYVGTIALNPWPVHTDTIHSVCSPQALLPGLPAVCE